MRIKILGMLLLGLLAMACAGTSANPLTGTALDPGVVYFVENHGGDHRNLQQIIANAIEVRNAKIGAIVADARSYQGSLSAMGDSYQEIVQRTAQQLFDGAP
jgi:ABC-type glycerol-3-phosphate transport system substrate-binding protein